MRCSDSHTRMVGKVVIIISLTNTNLREEREPKRDNRKEVNRMQEQEEEEHRQLCGSWLGKQIQKRERDACIAN